MTRLVVVRHGPTRLNEEHRLQGHGDPPLTPNGRSLAKRLGARLAARGCVPERGGGVWTSDLRRASETAELVFPGAPMRPDPRLRELDFGRFEGGTYRENLRRFGDHFEAWIADPSAVSPPRGEALASLRNRVARWLAERALEDGEGDCVAVTHGGVVRALLSLLLGVPFQDVVPSPVEPAGALLLGRREDGWTLMTVTADGASGAEPLPIRYALRTPDSNMETR